MKRNGIINGALADALATLRNTDLFVISDGGFPSGPRDRDTFADCLARSFFGSFGEVPKG